MMRANASPHSFRAMILERLHLYVAGSSPRSLRAVQEVMRVVRGSPIAGVRVEVEVIDVYRDPERARRAGVVGVPTLIRESPLPRRCVVGDFSDLARVLGPLEHESEADAG